MSNRIETFFEQALSRIPPGPDIRNGDILPPEHPERIENFPLLDELILSDFPVIDIAGMRDSDSWSAHTGEVSADDRRLLSGGLQEAGLHVCAFYKSRRYRDVSPFPGRWGIFYIGRAVRWISELLEDYYPGRGPQYQQAYEFLRQHERYHLAFDLYALSVEANVQRSRYEPLRKAFRSRRIHQVEEALANRAAWNWARQKTRGLEEFARDFMDAQPGAYSRYHESERELASELAANLLDLDFRVSARRYDQASWVAVAPDDLLRSNLCPEHLVRLTRISDWITPAWVVPAVRKLYEERIVPQLKSDGQLRQLWEATKRKLLANPGLPGLRFKLWDRTNELWAVRMNDNYRAHLRRRQAEGEWDVWEIGPHKAMGHG